MRYDYPQKMDFPEEEAKAGEIMGILGEIWDKIPVAGIIGRHNRQEAKKFKELKKQTKEMKKQTKELKKLRKRK